MRLFGMLRSLVIPAFLGLVAALAMTAVMLMLRWALGLPTTAELIGDRFAAAIPVRSFGDFIRFAGGYNELKQLGVGSVLAGQLAAGALGGVIYGPIFRRQRRGPTAAAGPGFAGRRSTVILWLALVGVWMVTAALLLPVLATHYGGLPAAPAMAAALIGLLVAYGTYGFVLDGLFRALARARGDGSETQAGAPLGRRRLLAVGTGGLIAAVFSGGILKALFDDATFGYDGTQVRGPDIQPITPNDSFYVVTKNVVDPDVIPSVWRLEVDGLVDQPASYRLDDLVTLAGTEQETTLMCISNTISGGLMSNARWRGVPLAALIEAARPRDGVAEVLCHGADGYSDSFSIEKALEPTTLLAYEMNGEPLPRRHGHPVRLLVPGLYGEKSVKWITRVELVDHDARGFYEQQGWGPDFVIPNRCRIDGPDLRDLSVGAPVPLQGTAFAGDRGVGRVEVSVSDGATWDEAQIIYPGTRLTWALWRYEWRPERAGTYMLAVRSTDQQGNVQSAERRGTVPEGQRGFHRVEATVTG